jgi:hypothetical protein
MMIRELYDVFVPEQEGIIHEGEIELIKRVLHLEGRDELSLRNLRDMVVLVYTLHQKNAGEDIDKAIAIMDQLSAVVSVIDCCLFNIGAEV